MTPVRAALLALCTLLIGAGIGWGAANLGGSGHESATSTAAPAAAGTAPASGAKALAACKSEETFGCYQRAFRGIVNSQNPGVALDDLDALYKSDAYVKRTCHPLAHEIGHLAYAKYRSVTLAEQYARETCWSGYHHGLMESYISQFDDRQLRAKMNGICKPDASHPYSLAYYNCWHGLGHGLTIRFTQDIFHALRFCNVIRRSWERQSCYSGVFMQNIVANGSGMHRAIDLKPSDPIYPCDAVTKQEKPSCYLMQTSYVLQVKNWNLPAAFGICNKVETGYVGTCYRSMGRDISGAALLDPGTIVSQCGMGAAAHRAECIAGAAANAVYDRHGRGMADALCKLVDPTDRAACLKATDDAVATL
ncbi:MAG TPA: hypothetical protein VFD90_19315 [Gaiellales bacterium]|nr:hypothetical protein [Gaiellales bacterium]